MSNNHNSFSQIYFEDASAFPDFPPEVHLQNKFPKSDKKRLRETKSVFYFWTNQQLDRLRKQDPLESETSASSNFSQLLETWKAKRVWMQNECSSLMGKRRNTWKAETFLIKSIYLQKR